MAGWKGRGARSTIAVIATMGALAGCAMFFPSRPLSEAMHIRNSPDSVEVLFCDISSVEFGSLSRGEFRGERVRLSVVQSVLEVDARTPTPISTLVGPLEDPSRLLPLQADEQFGFSFRDDAGVLHSGDFQLSDEIVGRFDEGLWLSTDGTLSIDPCE